MGQADELPSVVPPMEGGREWGSPTGVELSPWTHDVTEIDH